MHPLRHPPHVVQQDDQGPADLQQREDDARRDEERLAAGIGAGLGGRRIRRGHVAQHLRVERGRAHQDPDRKPKALPAVHGPGVEQRAGADHGGNDDRRRNGERVPLHIPPISSPHRAPQQEAPHLGLLAVTCQPGREHRKAPVNERRRRGEG